MAFQNLNEAIKAFDKHKIDLMFESEIGEQMGETFLAVHHYHAALAQIDVALYSLKLAQVWAAREAVDRRTLAREQEERDRRRADRGVKTC